MKKGSKKKLPAKENKDAKAMKMLREDLYALNQRFSKNCGPSSKKLLSYFLTQTVQTFRDYLSPGEFTKEASAEYSSVMTSILLGTKPKDSVEGMLAIQMIGVHNLAMEMMRRAMMEGQYREGIDANVNRAVKLLKTFTEHVQTLNKLRTGGQQKVTVEHVHVNPGGQAIVGAVSQKGMGGKQ